MELDKRNYFQGLNFWSFWRTKFIKNICSLDTVLTQWEAESDQAETQRKKFMEIWMGWLDCDNLRKSYRLVER